MALCHISRVFKPFPWPSDPMDCSLPGPSVHGIFQARVLEWVASAFSGWYQHSYWHGASALGPPGWEAAPQSSSWLLWLILVCVSCSVVSNSLQPYVACQAPLSMGFSRQEYWSGLPIPSPGDLPDPEIEPGSPALQIDSLQSDYLWGYHTWFTVVPCSPQTEPSVGRVSSLLWLWGAFLEDGVTPRSLSESQSAELWQLI